VTGTLLCTTLPVFLTLGAGFVMRWRQWLSDGFETGLMRLSLALLMPCLILDKVIGDPALNNPANVFLATGLGATTTVLSLILASLIAPLLGLRKGHGSRTFALTCALQNYGFLAIPVLISLFGEKPLGVHFLFGMGVELAIWTAGIMTLRGWRGANWRFLVNGPSLALVFGLALHYVHAHDWVPGTIRNTLAMLGQCAVPMSLFSIGATIAAETRNTAWTFDAGTLVGSVFCRLLLFPAAMLALASALPVSPELRMVMVVQAAMPSAVIPVVLAKIYGGHPITAVQVIVYTTVLSAFTMPFALAAGQKWLGL
jgi:malate permease and related proteins